jgi:hypothetical protein
MSAMPVLLMYSAGPKSRSTVLAPLLVAAS